jgi:hypothetical protein
MCQAKATVSFHVRKGERMTMGKKGRAAREREGAGSWRPRAAPEGPRRPGQAGGGEVDLQGASTQQLPELNDEDKATFAKIPLAFGVFWKL